MVQQQEPLCVCQCLELLENLYLKQITISWNNNISAGIFRNKSPTDALIACLKMQPSSVAIYEEFYNSVAVRLSLHCILSIRRSLHA